MEYTEKNNEETEKKAMRVDAQMHMRNDGDKRDMKGMKWWQAEVQGEWWW